MAGPAWLDPTALRVGLGCMRLWSGAGRAPDDSPEAAISAAVDSGITVFDTARTYDGPGGEAGGNERALSALLRARGDTHAIRLITKGGMRREGTAWIPDGRARTLLADCEASLAALDGLPISLYLLHAPDPSRPWATSLRALSRLLDGGLVARVGLSNITRAQLEEALAHVPVSAVEISLSPFDDTRLRDGTIALCAERGITVIAHSPLGGPRRVASVARNKTLRAVADRSGATLEEIALAWALDLAPNIVVIPGARRLSTVRSARDAAAFELNESQRQVLRAAFGGPRPAHLRAHPAPATGDVVLVMGIPGAGKSRIAQDYCADGYMRLNRDLRGGSLRDICAALDDALQEGSRRVVLDNTWLTRSVRSRAVDVAARHGIAIRCVWLEISLMDAQRNIVERLLERRELLPTPEEVRQFNGRGGMISPTAQMRALRELEPPAPGEGFTAVETVPFVREPAHAAGSPGVFIAASAAEKPGFAAALQTGHTAHLVFDWEASGDTALLDRAVARTSALTAAPVDAALCPHPAGPPQCWCRPSLLGLVLLFARNRGVDPSTSVMIGTGAAHKSMAAALGCRYAGV